jgi:hypothetical protein
MIELGTGQDPTSEGPPTYLMIRVTNNNQFVIRDRYDGVLFEFKPGVPVNINGYQAQHFFGFPGDADEMAVHMAKRFGWSSLEHIARGEGNRNPDAPMLFQTFAANIRLEAIEMELVPKARNLADDGLNVETMPEMPAGPGGLIPEAAQGTKVGQRAGSPVKRKPGRPPKVDPGFVPLG